MCDIRVFKSALADYDIAVNTFNTMEHDEMYLNSIAYHLQQSVEKTLKGFIDFVGVIKPFTHDIDKLCRMSKNNGSCVKLTEWIIDNADTIARWESDTHYNFDYCVELSKVKTGLTEIKHFLDLNRITTNKLITDDMKKELLLVLPKTLVPSNEFEWNIYYSVFEKQLKNETK